jgi:hypothetical protein
MISEGRLSGFVDQIESVLHFQASEQLAQWDRRIESFCVQVNQVLDKIQAVHPDWCQKTMASVEAKINAATNDDDDMTTAEQVSTTVKSMDVS